MILHKDHWWDGVESMNFAEIKTVPKAENKLVELFLSIWVFW